MSENENALKISELDSKKNFCLMYKIYRNFIFALLKLFFSVESSRRSSCRLLNLLFEDENALSLLRGQHGNLFWGQLQDLHDQGSLEREYKPAINFLKEDNSSSVLLDRRAVSYLLFMDTLTTGGTRILVQALVVNGAYYMANNCCSLGWLKLVFK